MEHGRIKNSFLRIRHIGHLNPAQVFLPDVARANREFVKIPVSNFLFKIFSCLFQTDKGSGHANQHLFLILCFEADIGAHAGTKLFGSGWENFRPAPGTECVKRLAELNDEISFEIGKFRSKLRRLSVRIISRDLAVLLVHFYKPLQLFYPRFHIVGLIGECRIQVDALNYNMRLIRTGESKTEKATTAGRGDFPPYLFFISGLEQNGIIIGFGYLILMAEREAPVFRQRLQFPNFGHYRKVSVIAHPYRGLMGSHKSQHGAVLIDIRHPAHFVLARLHYKMGHGVRITQRWKGTAALQILLKTGEWRSDERIYKIYFLLFLLIAFLCIPVQYQTAKNQGQHG